MTWHRVALRDKSNEISHILCFKSQIPRGRTHAEKRCDDEARSARERGSEHEYYFLLRRSFVSNSIRPPTNQTIWSIHRMRAACFTKFPNIFYLVKMFESEVTKNEKKTKIIKYFVCPRFVYGSFINVICLLCWFRNWFVNSISLTDVVTYRKMYKWWWQWWCTRNWFVFIHYRVWSIPLVRSVTNSIASRIATMNGPSARNETER